MKQIILLKKGNDYETWGSLTDVCNNHKGFSYHYLKSKKFPFTYKGVEFIKVPYKQINF